MNTPSHTWVHIENDLTDTVRLERNVLKNPWHGNSAIKQIIIVYKECCSCKGFTSDDTYAAFCSINKPPQHHITHCIGPHTTWNIASLDVWESIFILPSLETSQCWKHRGISWLHNIKEGLNKWGIHVNRIVRSRIVWDGFLKGSYAWRTAMHCWYQTHLCGVEYELLLVPSLCTQQYLNEFWRGGYGKSSIFSCTRAEDYIDHKWTFLSGEQMTNSDRGEAPLIL